jgi:hypothetical protein
LGCSRVLPFGSREGYFFWKGQLVVISNLQHASLLRKEQYPSYRADPERYRLALLSGWFFNTYGSFADDQTVNSLTSQEVMSQFDSTFMVYVCKTIRLTPSSPNRIFSKTFGVKAILQKGSLCHLSALHRM